MRAGLPSNSVHQLPLADAGTGLGSRVSAETFSIGLYRVSDPLSRSHPLELPRAGRLPPQFLVPESKSCVILACTRPAPMQLGRASPEARLRPVVCRRTRPGSDRSGSQNRIRMRNRYESSGLCDRCFPTTTGGKVVRCGQFGRSAWMPKGRGHVKLVGILSVGVRHAACFTAATRT